MKDKALREKLKRYRAENAALRQQIADLQKEHAHVVAPTPSSDTATAPDAATTRAQRLFRSQGRRAHHFGKRTYFRFLIECFTDSSFYLQWRKILAFARRIRLARTVGLVLTFVLAAAQTSALFVVFSAAYLVALPFLVMGSGIGLFISVLHSRSVNRRLRHALNGCHVRILLPSKAVSFCPARRAFFFASARSMAAEPNTAVIVVSPYALSTKGFGSRRLFFTARCEGPRLYLVRKSYYFILRRHVLTAVDPDLSILY